MTHLTTAIDRFQTPLRAFGVAVLLGLGLPAAVPADQIVVRSDPVTVARLRGVFPLGVQRGKTVRLTLDGENLDGNPRLIVSGTGITVVSLDPSADHKVLRARLAIARDAPLGARDLRVACAHGLSDVRAIQVDDLPQTAQDPATQKKPAAGPRGPGMAGPQWVEAPTVINGRLGAMAIDRYRFWAEKGQRLVFEIEARRLRSPIDPVLTLSDDQGRELQSQMSSRALGHDTRIDYTFRRGGEYMIQLRDLMYQGGPDYTYRLRIGDFPYATAMFPLGGRRGAPVALTLQGGDLSEPFTTTVTPGADGLNTPHRLWIQTPSGMIETPMQFAAAELPEVAEPEVGHPVGTANHLTVPGIANGRIDRPGAVDRWVFHAARGQKLTLRVEAASLGSWLDSYLTLKDARGHELQSNDDALAAPPPRGGFGGFAMRTPRPGSEDSLIRLTVPADGDYTATVADVNGYGGPQYAYRLIVAADRANFQLAATPGTPPLGPVFINFRGPQAPPANDALNLPHGSTTVLTVTATRSGYTGPISLGVEGLPKGMTASKSIIAAGQAQGTITLKVAEDAAPAAALLRVVGTAQVNGKRLSRTAIHRVNLVGPAALPDERPMDSLAVGITEDPTALLAKVTLPRPRVGGLELLVQGTKALLPITLTRAKLLDGPLIVRSLGQIPGVGVPRLSALPRGKDVVTIPITVQATAPPGQRVVLLLAQTAKGNRSAALLISLPVQVSPPVILSHDPAGPIPLPPGQSATVTLKARRVGGVKSAVSFDFPGLPRGVTVEGPKKIAPGQSEVALTFHAGPHAGGRVQVGIQAKATVNNQVVPLGPNRTFLTLAIGAAPPRKTPSPSRKKPPVQEAGNG